MKADLRLAMYQDINIKLFLEFNNFADLLFNRSNILFLRDPENNKIRINKKKANVHENKPVISSQNILLVSLVFTAHPPQFNSLREGSNCGRWENWKVELLLLSIQSGADICCTAMIRALQCSSL